MYTKLLSTVSGHCNYLNKRHSIEIEFAEVPILGKLSPGYKKMGYRCSYSSECNCLDEYGACDLYHQVNSPY